jgi:hypothetical protein
MPRISPIAALRVSDPQAYAARVKEALETHATSGQAAQSLGVTWRHFQRMLKDLASLYPWARPYGDPSSIRKQPGRRAPSDALESDVSPVAVPPVAPVTIEAAALEALRVYLQEHGQCLQIVCLNELRADYRQALESALQRLISDGEVARLPDGTIVATT